MADIGYGFKQYMMKYFLTSFLILLTFSLVSAQDCEVKLEEISGTYEGKCKKGLANGKGIAKGADTYEGTFKKGLPDGQGIYTFANGNVFTGEFDKGKKSGKGVMTFSTEDVPTLEGYWLDDEYTGKDKKVYNLVDRSTSIKTVRFKRMDGESNKIVFKFTNQGKPVKVAGLEFDCPVAVFSRDSQFDSHFEISEFPVKGNVRFRAAALKTANGTAEYISGQAEFEIKFRGNWEVTFEMNNAE